MNHLRHEFTKNPKLFSYSTFALEQNGNTVVLTAMRRFLIMSGNYKQFSLFFSLLRGVVFRVILWMNSLDMPSVLCEFLLRRL